MFITDEDYKVVIGEQALRVVSQVSVENRANAETEAIEEISGYLRPKYDTEIIFAATGAQRNRLVVMYTCDIALYHMAASTPQKMSRAVANSTVWISMVGTILMVTLFPSCTWLMMVPLISATTMPSHIPM